VGGNRVVTRGCGDTLWRRAGVMEVRRSPAREAVTFGGVTGGGGASKVGEAVALRCLAGKAPGERLAAAMCGGDLSVVVDAGAGGEGRSRSGPSLAQCGAKGARAAAWMSRSW
jgi:hypothetical protein